MYGLYVGSTVCDVTSFSALKDYFLPCYVAGKHFLYLYPELTCTEFVQLLLLLLL
jgi:hypothetical protein